MVLLSLLFNLVAGGFHIGRLSEGQFEYPALNGWMTADSAKQLCDNDSVCGGFTYKVLSHSMSKHIFLF